MAAPASKEGAPLMDTLCQVDIVGPFIVDGAELNPGDILSEVQPPYLAPWLHTKARAIATQVEARSTSAVQDGVVTRSFNPYLNCRDLAVASTVSRACHMAAAHMGSLSSCRGCQRLQVLPSRQAGPAAAHQSLGNAANPRAVAATGSPEEIQEDEEEEEEESDEDDYEEEEEEIDEEEEEEEEELEVEEEEEEETEDEVLELKDEEKDKLLEKSARALHVNQKTAEAANSQEVATDEKNVSFRAAAEAQLKAEAKALKAWKAAKGTDDLSLKAEEAKIERKDAPGLEQVCQEVKEKVEAASQDMLKAFAEKMLQSLMNQKVPTEELKAAVAQFKVSSDTFLMSDPNVKAKVSIETSSAGSSDSRSAKTDSEACPPDSKMLVQEMMKLLQSRVQAGKVKSSSGDVEAEIRGLWKVPLTPEVMVQLKGDKEKDGHQVKAPPSLDALKEMGAVRGNAAVSTSASSDTAASDGGVKDVDEMVVINMLNPNQQASHKGAAISLKRSFKKKLSGADAASDVEMPNAHAMTEFQQALTAAASAAGSAQAGASSSVKGSIQDIETLEKVSAKLADQVAELALKAPIEIGWTTKKEDESAAAPKEVEVPVPSVAARSAKSQACAASDEKAASAEQEVQAAAAKNSRPSTIPFQKASEKKAANQEETTQLSSASRPSASPSASPATPAGSATPTATPSAGAASAASGAPAAAAASDASPSTAMISIPRRHARLSGMKGFQCNGLYVEDRKDTFVQKAAEVEDPEVSYFLRLYDSWQGNSCADVFQVQAGNNMRTITLAGFEIDGVNVQYRERREPKLMVDQNETYWTANLDFFLFWCGKHSRWRVGRATDWTRIQSGDPLSVAEGPQNCVDLRAPSKGWHEWKAPKWVYRKHAGITSVSSSGPRGERVIASCAPDGWRIAAQRQTKQRGSTQWRPAQSVKLEIQNAGAATWSLYPQNCRYEDEAAAADRCMEELLRSEGTSTSASNRSPKASRHKPKLETPTDTPTAKSSASKAPKQQRDPQEGAEERLLRLQLQAEEELLREEEEEDKRRQEEATKRKEAKRRREQEESRRKEAAEGARSREEKARKAREEEARKAKEDEAKKAREENAARRAAEEEVRRKEERRKKEEEEQRLLEKARKAAEKKKEKAEERRRQEAEARRKMEEEKAEEARRQAEMRQKELEQAQRAEEERHRRELEQQQREEEAKRRREFEQQQREREEEAKRRAEEARKQAEAKRKWMEQARSREEERRRLEAEQRRSEEEALRKNEENRKRAEQEVIRRLQAARAETEMRKRREEQRPTTDAAVRAAYPVEAEMEKRQLHAHNSSHSHLNMEPAASTLSVAEADRGAGQSRRGNDYGDAPMVRARDEGIVEPTLCQVTLQYNATNVGYLTAYPSEWIVIQCWEGSDEWEPGGWGYGYVRGDEKRCGWLPQRVLRL